jgi:membrane associated rhomboid family serine protease
MVDLILKINIAVFALWVLGSSQFMMNNFLVSYDLVQSGRIWTLITSVFSHNMIFHLFINMFILYGFGNIMENIMGSKKFIIFYLIAGLVGSLAHCLASALLMGQSSLPALGASGAVAGVVVLFALMNPKQLVLLFGIIPMPAIGAAGLFILFDLWGLISQTRGSEVPIGHGAHLGGALVGIIYFLATYKSHKLIHF